MKDIFQEKIKGLDKYRWITIQDCSEEMEEWLKENDDEYTDSLTIGELKDMIHQMINTNK